jgi:transposase
MNRYPAINSVLVMDRASIHMGLQVPKLCDRAGVKLIYLPLKSPHLSPLQSCISMIKRDLRRSRSLILERDPIWMIRRRTCDIIDDQLCRKVFKQAGLRCPPDTVTDDDAKSNISGSE